MAIVEGRETFQAYLDSREAIKRPEVRNSGGFTVSGKVFGDVVGANSRLDQENLTLKERIGRMEKEIASLIKLNNAFISAVNAFSEAPPRRERHSEPEETASEEVIVDTFSWEYSKK